MSDYFVSGMHDELGTLEYKLLAEYLRHHHEEVKRLPVSELLLAQLSYSDCRAGKCKGVRREQRGVGDMWALHGGNRYTRLENNLRHLSR